MPFLVTLSLYDLLEIPDTASPDQIDHARGRAIAMWTEDWSRESGVLQEHLNAAWHVLRNPSSRAAYDTVLADGHAPEADDLVRPEVVKHDDADEANEALEALRRDWPAGLPPLPGTVTEVTLWGTGTPDGDRYKPSVTDEPAAAAKAGSKLDRKQRKRMNEVENGGFRTTNALTRSLVGVMLFVSTAGFAFGGYLVYCSMSKKNPGSVTSASSVSVTINATRNRFE